MQSLLKALLRPRSLVVVHLDEFDDPREGWLALDAIFGREIVDHGEQLSAVVNRDADGPSSWQYCSNS